MDSDQQTPAAERRWAVAISVGEEPLNAMAAASIGAGIDMGVVHEQVAVPMLGEANVSVDMAITGVTFAMDERHAGRLLASVHARGDVVVHSDMMGEMPLGRVHVSGDVLVDLDVAVEPHGAVRAHLDLPNSDLVATHFHGIEGVETDADMQAQMGEMLFASVGGDLFGGLADSMGRIGIDLPPEVGRVLLEAGVRPGPAVVEVRAGHVVVALESARVVHGDAEPPAPGPGHLSIGLASGVLGVLTERLVATALGLEIPFELSVRTARDRIVATVRNERLVAIAGLPDLRPGMRYEIGCALEGRAVAVSLHRAWLRLPLVPPVVDEIGRFAGGAVGMAPLRLPLPAELRIPVTGTPEDAVLLRVASIDIGRRGVYIDVTAEADVVVGR